MIHQSPGMAAADTMVLQLAWLSKLWALRSRSREAAVKLPISQEQVGRIDQHIRGESFHSPVKRYHKAKSSGVSESTKQPSDTVWTNAKSI